MEYKTSKERKALVIELKKTSTVFYHGMLIDSMGWIGISTGSFKIDSDTKLKILEHNQSLIGSSLMFTGPYKTAMIKIPYTCLKCGYDKGSIRPSDANSGVGCKKCAEREIGEQRRTNLKSANELRRKNQKKKDISVDKKGEYTVHDIKYTTDGKRAKIHFTHTVCGKSESMKLGNWTGGFGCGHCSRSRKKSIEEYFSIRENKYGDSNMFTPIGDIFRKGEKPHIKMKCVEHDRDFDQNLPDWVNQGSSSCRGCKKYNKSETLIAKMLNEHYKKMFGEFITNAYLIKQTGDYSEDLGGGRRRNLELDMHNPEMWLAVEYNGEQHYNKTNIMSKTDQALKKIQYRDKIKNKWCKERGIKLITIPYWEFSYNMSTDKKEQFFEDLILEIDEWIEENNKILI